MKIEWKGRPAEIDGEKIYYTDGKMEDIEESEEVLEAYSDEIIEELREFLSMEIYDLSKW